MMLPSSVICYISDDVTIPSKMLYFRWCYHPPSPVIAYNNIDVTILSRIVFNWWVHFHHRPFHSTKIVLFSWGIPITTVHRWTRRTSCCDLSSWCVKHRFLSNENNIKWFGRLVKLRMNDFYINFLLLIFIIIIVSNL